MKPNHHSLNDKRQAAPNKTYKDLKQKQKAQIADWMYRETLRFYLKNQRMPDEAECDQLCRVVFTNGAPYGVTWEEMGMEPYEDEDFD